MENNSGEAIAPSQSRMKMLKTEVFTRFKTFRATKHGNARKLLNRHLAADPEHSVPERQTSYSKLQRRPPRPPSIAPQVGRFILDRDPGPFFSLAEHHHSGDNPSGAHQGLQITSEVPHEYQRNLIRTSCASFLPHNNKAKRSNDLPPRCVDNVLAEGECNTAQHHSSGVNSMLCPGQSSSSLGSTCQNWETATGAIPPRRNGAQRTSRNPQVSPEVPLHPLDRSALRMSMLADSQEVEDGLVGFREEHSTRPYGFTIHPVPPSTSSSEKIYRDSDSSKALSTQGSLYRSNSNRCSSQLLHTSQSRTGSYGISSQLPLHMKQRRQLPPTARFSNSSKSASVSPSSQGGHRVRIGGLLHATDDDLTRFPRYSSDGTMLKRKRSRVAVERLGRRIHSVSSTRSEASSSLLSAATSGRMESRIRRLFEESKDKSSSEEHSDDPVRYSLQRLSSLPEALQSPSRSSAVHVWANRGQYGDTQYASPVLSRSFQGELGESEWETETASAEGRGSGDVSTGGNRSRSLTPGYL